MKEISHQKKYISSNCKTPMQKFRHLFILQSPASSSQSISAIYKNFHKRQNIFMKITWAQSCPICTRDASGMQYFQNFCIEIFLIAEELWRGVVWWLVYYRWGKDEEGEGKTPKSLHRDFKRIDVFMIHHWLTPLFLFF